MNRQVRLTSRPDGIPRAEHFEIVEIGVPELQPGQILVRNIYLSVEPAMRGWLSAVRNCAEPVAIGAGMRSFAAGRVEASKDAAFEPGALVTGMFGWQDYAVVEGRAIQRRFDERDPPLSKSLGVMEISGVTAHYGLLGIWQPRPGETVAAPDEHVRSWLGRSRSRRRDFVDATCPDVLRIDACLVWLAVMSRRRASRHCESHQRRFGSPTDAASRRPVVRWG